MSAERRKGILVLCYKQGGLAGSIPDEAIAYFSVDLILPAALGPGVDSASNRNLPGV
jgi:hypothetical protein